MKKKGGNKMYIFKHSLSAFSIGIIINTLNVCEMYSDKCYCHLPIPLINFWFQGLVSFWSSDQAVVLYFTTRGQQR